MADPIDLNEPQEGYYRRRLVRGGPWVAARIWWVRGDIDQETSHQMSDDVLRCVVNGRRRDPYREWLWLAKEPITEAEYNFLVDDAAHARAHRPDDPKGKPDAPIDLNKMDPIF